MITLEAHIEKLILNQKLILSDINLKVQQGDFLGLTGKNGAGKSVLLRTLAGIYHVDSGYVKRNENFFYIGNVSAITKGNLSFKDNLRLVLLYYQFEIEKYDQQKLNHFFEIFEVQHHLDTFFYRLSQGYRLRVLLIAFLILDIPNLIMDEFFGFGDASTRNIFREIVFKKISKINSIILATHNKSILKQYCNKILEIEEGKIISESAV